MSVRSRQSSVAEMREHSVEEKGSLEMSRDPSGDVGDVLQNIVRSHGVSNTQKMKQLHDFIELVVGHQEDELGFTHQEIIICVRVSLLSDCVEVRAAGLRALRYLISDSGVLDKVLALQVDYLVARCIDMQDSSKAEKTQALRLVRKMMAVDASLFPSSLTNALMAVGNEGSLEVDGNMVRPCVAIICELSLKNPLVVAQSSGLSAILRNVIGCRLNGMNESLIATVLHLLNHPDTRRFVRADVELEQILAPYTDFHYRLTADVTEEQLKENRDARFLASKMSIIAAFRSWSGVITLCKTGNSGLQSLIDLLCVPNTEVRRGLLELIYQLFLLDVPVETTDFTEALISVDPGRRQKDWRLSEGFIVSEALVILPQRSSSKPNLIDNYLAFLLGAFIHSRLLEGLVELITSSEDFISIQATVLLGQLLHMANRLLPHCHSHHLHCLPSLLNMAASSDIPRAHRQQASMAVTHLKRLHERKKRGPAPHSLYLDHVLRKTAATAAALAHGSVDLHHRPPQRDVFPMKESDEALLGNLRDSHVLHHDENLDWDWELVQTVLKWPNIKLQSNKDEHIHKFVRRLLWFFMPSSKLFVSMKWDHPNARQTAVVGCELVEFLLDSEEEGDVYLEDLVRDIVQWLHPHSSSSSSKSSSSSSSGSSSSSSSSSLHGKGLLLTTLSQYYFLFLGTMSAHRHGVHVLEKGSVYQCLLHLCMQRNQEHVVKLTVSTLDFSHDSLARVILSKVLIAAADSARLYATQYLRVLLRANAEFFSTWGVELLVVQLYDRSPAVLWEALDILDEACEDKANLHALVELKPALTHLGDKGQLLLLRFLSIPKGFSYLEERGYITEELTRWHQVCNLRYVDMMEEQLNEALTSYRPSWDTGSPGHTSTQRPPRVQRPSVYPPVHLYGQLVQDKAGRQLLEEQNVLPDLSSVVRSPSLDQWEGVKALKAALWALGNIGCTTWGVSLLLEEGVVSEVVGLAQHCEVLSVRGTCLYVLGMLAKTRRGCNVLSRLGWDAVRHSRRTPWPVAPEESELLQPQAWDADPLLQAPPPRARKPLSSPLARTRHYSEGSQPMELHSAAYIEEDERNLEHCESLLSSCRKTPLKDRRGPGPRLSSRSLQNRRLTSTSPAGDTQRHPEAPDTGTTARPSPKPPCPAQAECPTGVGGGGCRLATSLPGPSDGYQEMDPWEERTQGLPWAMDPPLGPEDPRERGEGSSGRSSRDAGAGLRLNTDATTGLPEMSTITTGQNKDVQTATTTMLVPPPPSSGVQLSGSGSMLRVLPGPPDGASPRRLHRHTQSLRVPSISMTGVGRSFTRSSFSSSCSTSSSLTRSASLCHGSSRDALGYATLRRLQQQSIQPFLSHSEAMASPANDVLFADAIAMKIGRPDARFAPRRFVKALSFTAFNREDLLCPINHNTLRRSSSWRAMATADSAGRLHGDEYIGIALPACITNMLHITEIPYFQESLRPPAEVSSLHHGTSDGPGEGAHPVGGPDALPEAHKAEPAPPAVGPEDSGLQEHSEDNCLYCSGLSLLGLKSHSSRPDIVDGLLFSEWCSTASHHLDVTMVQGRLSSAMSGSTLSQCSGGSGHSGAELVLGVKSVPENGPSSGALLRKEVLRLVVNLSSSVGMKGNQSSLLTIKEKFPQAFDDVCLYSEVSHLLAHTTFRLQARRFIQELFQDVSFLPLYEEAESVLTAKET